jgi:phage host-nuclease inhibitor protein Gam
MPAAARRQLGRPEGSLAGSESERHDAAIEPPIEHRDVTTIMALLGDIQSDVRRIRNLLEDENGEEEEEVPEDDA